MKKLIRYFYGILPFFAAEAIQFTVANILYTIYAFVYSIENNYKSTSVSTLILQTPEEIINENALYLISVIGVLICGIIFTYWYRKEVRGEKRGSINKIFTTKNITMLLLMGIGCQFFLTGLLNILKQFFKEILAEYAEHIEKLTGGNMIAFLLLTLLIAPISEELIFRGVILRKTSKEITFLGANILQALLFGIYHWSLVQGVYAACIGFLLGMVYQKFNTIIAPILLHIIINASSFLIQLFPNTLFAYAFITIFGTTAAALSVFLLKPAGLLSNNISRGVQRH